MSDFDVRWSGTFIPRLHWHFHRRLMQRYGMVLEPGQYIEILRQIRIGRTNVLERRKGGLAVNVV